MGIDLPRHEGARMIEADADDLDVDAFVERQGRPGVAQAVDRQPRWWLVGSRSVVLRLLASDSRLKRSGSYTLPLGLQKPSGGGVAASATLRATRFQRIASLSAAWMIEWT